MSKRSHHVALIPGDGIGPEVIAEAKRVVEASRAPVVWTELPWGSQYRHDLGTMMPEGAIGLLEEHDAILLGAVGSPSLPDHVTGWEMILEIRQRLDLWANVRPVTLLPGIDCPLVGRSTSDIDMVFIRENTEGEYSGIGGRSHATSAAEIAIEVAVFTRTVIQRLADFAFRTAAGRRGSLVSATKSNACRHGYLLWDEVVGDVAALYPEVRYERVLVDALAARLIRDPASIDVVVASNLFGDILTDLAAELQGGMGTAASANLAPGSQTPGLFEPVHGSAPSLAGTQRANPIGAIWSAALMLEHLGEGDQAALIMEAVREVCQAGPRTVDVGGSGSTTDVGDAIAQAVEARVGGAESDVELKPRTVEAGGT